MRRIETGDMLLYYPDGRRDEAVRFVERVGGCAAYLESAARIHNSVSDQKMLVILPELPFNNAFVIPRLGGYETVAVVPSFNTADMFMLESGLPPDPGVIGCHEITHYVHFQQIAGFAWFWNQAFGQVYSPQIGLDSWFDEGLAVYYETKLQSGVGRLAWPFWHGVFAAGAAGRHLDGGDLSPFNRDFYGGNHYLFGSEFIGFLAGRYGEDKLWDLVAVQARSIFFPLGVNLRFRQAFGKTLSTLIDEFAADVALRAKMTARPADQRMLRAAGYSTRYARALDGTEALITEDRDRPSRLVILSPDGQVRTERDLIDVIPPRLLKISSPQISGGLSFTGDGSALYFVALDLDATYQAARLMRFDLGAQRLTVVNRDLNGVGGAVSPDGARYLFPRVDGDHHDLAALDLRTGAVRLLAVEPHGAFVAQPRFSPDGTRLVATVFDGAHFTIVVFDATTGATLTTLPIGSGPAHEASWADDHRIVYLGTTAADWRFQVYVYDLANGSTVKVTNAPYLAFEPQAAGGGTVRFLNREGWRWTLDEVALPAPAAPVALSPAAPLAAHPPAVVAAPPPAFLASDRPYSQLDHLFVPQLYGPTIAVAGRVATLFGVVLSGNDRLMFHRWTVSGSYQLGSPHPTPSVSFGYSNRQLAPFTLSLSGLQDEVYDPPPQLPGQPAPTVLSLYRRERQAELEISRSFYENPVSLGAAAIESYRPGDLAVALHPLQRFAGPYLSASYTGVETTPYTGARRLLELDAYVAAFPKQWTTAAAGFVDLKGTWAVIVPLPLLLRQRLAVDLRARSLSGLPDSDRLLLVGGDLVGTLWNHSNRVERNDSVAPLGPPQLPFTEYLRGFEDHALATNRIAILDLTYRYPFIIDRGFASTFGIFPSFFLQQIDLRFFGTGATDGGVGGRHAAAGGSLTARFFIWDLGFGLQYQLARRLTDDDALVQLVVLAAG